MPGRINEINREYSCSYCIIYIYVGNNDAVIQGDNAIICKVNEVPTPSVSSSNQGTVIFSDFIVMIV